MSGPGPATPARPVRIEPASGWFDLDLSEIWRFRDLGLVLMSRDVRLRYRQTALGVVWVVLQPLAAALIFAVIFGRFAGLPSEGVAYLPYAFAALLPWNLFAGSVQRAGSSLVSDARLIQKVYFPRMLIPIAACGAVLVDFAVSLGVMAILMGVYGLPATLRLLSLPALVILAILVSVGVSLFFSALSVHYRDFMHVLPFVVQVWLYVSPVVYSPNLIPDRLRPIFALNPLVGIIEGFRWALLGGRAFPSTFLAFSVAGGLVLCLAGALVFNRVERSFADVV